MFHIEDECETNGNFVFEILQLRKTSKIVKIGKLIMNNLKLKMGFDF